MLSPMRIRVVTVGGVTYTPAEKAAAQGLNDLLVFSSSAAAAFLSGALQQRFGWEAVNLGVLPAIAISAAASLDRKSTRLNSSHVSESRMPSSA